MSQGVLTSGLRLRLSVPPARPVTAAGRLFCRFRLTLGLDWCPGRRQAFCRVPTALLVPLPRPAGDSSPACNRGAGRLGGPACVLEHWSRLGRSLWLARCCPPSPCARPALARLRVVAVHSRARRLSTLVVPSAWSAATGGPVPVAPVSTGWSPGSALALWRRRLRLPARPVTCSS